MRVEPIKKEKDIEKVKRYMKKLEDQRIYILFMIGINTGLRISDIVPLKVKDVYKQTHIDLKQKKNRQYNKLIINESLKEALNEYCKDKKRNDYLFPSQKGDHIQEDRAYVLLKKVFKKCRLRYNTGTHTLRKTCGYHTNKKNGIEVTQKILDHDSPKDTLRYVGLEQEEMDMALGGLNL